MASMARRLRMESTISSLVPAVLQPTPAGKSKEFITVSMRADTPDWSSSWRYPRTVAEMERSRL